MQTKADKREGAAARDTEHCKLTLQQKILKAKSRPGNSAREITRLEQPLAAMKEAK